MNRNGKNSFLLLVKMLFSHHILSRWVQVCNGVQESTKWFQKYDNYPSYCSTPEEMETRKIPPLTNVDHAGETRIVHVTVVLRHGARTPWKAGLNCWEGYNEDPVTSQWNCSLSTYLATPSLNRVHFNEETENSDNESSESDDTIFLFEKRYDALNDPENNLRNELGGTCQLGQLLVQGYEQEQKNGLFLRDAYVYSDNDFDHDPRMQLLDSSINGIDNKYLWDSIRYRVDDDQRTLMSGQVVLQGLFGPELTSFVQTNHRYPLIPLHTADRHRDILDANENVCPRIKEIEEVSMQSDGYKAMRDSINAQQLLAFQREILKIPDQSKDMDAIDCLMTTMCTDRSLPDPVNDFHHFDNTNTSETENDAFDKKYGANRFQRLVDFETGLWGYTANANDALYSKLSMGPLWVEIMNGIYPFVMKSDETININPSETYLLSLIAGHDTTLIPLLVSLGPDVWDGVWPPYASMMVLELYSVQATNNTDTILFQSDHAFRLIYNGNVITNRITGCDINQELCDIQVLLEHVESFMKWDNASCTRQGSTPMELVQDVARETETFALTKDGAVAMVFIVLCSMFVGASITYIYLLRSFPVCCLTRKQEERRCRDKLTPIDQEDLEFTTINYRSNDPGNGYHNSKRSIFSFVPNIDDGEEITFHPSDVNYMNEFK